MTNQRHTDRIYRERIAGPQIVQDGRAIRPGGGAGGCWPTGRKAITTLETTLTRDDRDKLIYYDGDLFSGDGVLWLPAAADLKKKDTFWFVLKPTGGAVSIRPSRTTAILAPVALGPEYEEDDLVQGYGFDYLGAEQTPYEREDLYFAPVGQYFDGLTWAVMTYTGQIRQVAVGFVDANSNGVYDEGEELIYSDATLWDCWRCSGATPQNFQWCQSDEPFYGEQP
jgi:hypothetical protein